MKKMQFKALLLGISMCLTLVMSAQNNPYQANSLTQFLNQRSSQITESSAIQLELQEGTIAEGTVNLVQNVNGEQRLVGAINNENQNTFHLEILNGQLTGQSVLLDQNLAFEYFTKNGVVYARELDIHDVICTDFDRVKHRHDSDHEHGNQILKNSNDPYALESFPGAPGCVYIDFDGEYVAGTYWNSGDPINAAPANFSDAKMIEVWEIAAEDFRPFGINVTTSRAVFDSYPKTRRMQAIVTPTNTAAPGSGGVAYIGSFSWNDDTPCWVFNLGTKACGETVSHEIGHTLNLRHDGKDPSTTYYSGQGDWAPIMGASFYDPITHWSKGEYADANNQEDDLALITGTRFGVGYRVDQHGNSTSNATALQIESNGDVLASKNDGIIEKTNDLDFFSFSTTGGNVTLNFNTVSRHGNLDILARVYNNSGNLIATANGTGLNASYSANLAAGNYYVSIDGTGAGNVLTTGYTDYASLGYYTISGNIPVSGELPNEAPTVSITSPDNGDVYNTNPASINIEATANDVDGNVVKVEFLVNGTKIGEDLNAPYNFNYSAGLGSYNLEARATDDDGAVTTSTTVIVTVQNTTTGCNTPAWTSSSIYTGGDQASYNGVLYEANWWTSGDRPDLNSGQYQVWSAIGPCSGGNIAPEVSISSPSNGSTYISPANFGITANASDADGSVSNVEFYINGNSIASDNTSPYSASASITTSGTYDIYAIATDNEGGTTTSASVSITVEEDVNTPPTVVITSPNNGSSFTNPASVSITADANDADGSISQVGFFINGTLVATDNSAPYTFTDDYATGSYDVYAVAQDNEGATTNSSTISFTVEEKVNIPPTVVITAPSDGSSFNDPASVNITADASDSDGTISQVTFYIDGTIVGTDNSAPYTYTNTFGIGTYQLYATASDDLGATSNSTTITFTVKEEGNCSVAAWSSSAVYIGGDQASYNGTIYEAKWWTTNTQPDLYSGPWDVWKVIGACGSPQIEASESANANGSNEIEDISEVQLYPNPNQGQFMISLDTDASVTIFNSSGSVVYQTNLNAGIQNLNLDLSSGMYNMIVTSNSNQTNLSFIVK